ncbi:hypothetical protein [Pleionea mediterranea]|uniref:Uncharacterized protein n=1 Tax=Pleionea mediterranea TaxID=523701 RepID=A0A316G630_9GAMM|nr:hypothetical protein [Pleionea mediterranea]PWK49887.1 hypothetical protein C8D97_10748 [Pleionea mediterranea]
MSKEKSFEEALLDLLEDEILSLSDSELKEIYGSDNLQATADYQSTTALIDEELTKHKKNKLVQARREINKNNERKVRLKSKSKRLSDAKEFIIQLMLNNKVPEGLTLAFREGEDIPDEEIESIIEDLKDLGIDVEDE